MCVTTTIVHSAYADACSVIDGLAQGHLRLTLRASTWSMNMQCDRLLAMFMGVSQMVRFVSPRNSCAAARSTMIDGTRSSVEVQCADPSKDYA